ncbi:MAG: GWxTD domain-containing protein, partial [Bacteroidota bacterium]
LLADQETIISGYLMTSELTEGDYLLDITIAGGGGDALQETASFRVGSNIRQMIFSNLDDAIRKMTFILPESSVKELLDNPSEEARKIEFLEAWQDLYHEEADFEMEKYYLRLEEVDEKFADARPGWQTDRGRIYMQYGEPGRIDEISRGGISYRRWIYPQWSMMFLFKERNQTFLLVE